MWKTITFHCLPGSRCKLTNFEDELHYDRLAMKSVVDNLGALYHKWSPSDFFPEEFTAYVDAIVIGKAKVEVCEKKIEESRMALLK
jgi:hypothetical protein